jgi:DNA-binding beta-propeller fold protein YncE
MNARILGSLVLLPLVACDAETYGEPEALDDPRFPTGSAAMIASSDYETIYTANPDNGTVSLLDVDSGAVLDELAVGLEPVRLARAGEHLFVTLRHERAVVVLKDTGGALEIVDRIATGAEPYGIVAGEDGTRLYVAASLSNRVEEIDAQSFERLRTFSVADQPRWLALHPNDSVLYVGSAMRGTLSVISLESGLVTKVDLPGLYETRTDRVHDRSVTVGFARRITGDLAVSPDGKDVYVPTTYVDNTTTVPTADEDNPTGGGGGGYNGSPEGSRMNPGVVEVPVAEDGTPVVDNAGAIDATVSVDGMLTGSGGGDLMSLFGRVSGYISSVAVSPDGKVIFATIEGGNTIVALSRLPMVNDGDRTLLQRRDTAAVLTNAGPRGLAFTSDTRAWVFSGLDRTVAEFDAREAMTRLGRDGFEATFVTTGPVEVAPNVLPLDVERGRRLFYSTMDMRMASPGAGVSCSTCHFDGRNDGLTWPLEGGLRQTPSLAGEVSLTAPVTWTDNVATVAHEVVITSQGRMGGFGLLPEESDDVAAFVDFGRLPDSPRKGSSDELVALGEEIFNRSEVGCGECHSTEIFTDNKAHDLFGLNGVYTPTLLGISASAPYLHDGSVSSLRGLLANLEGMGSVSSLSSEEIEALARYLESL